MTKEEKIQQVADSIVRNAMNKAKCIIIVNNQTKRYECLEINDILQNFISRQGNLGELYDALFLCHKVDHTKDTGVYRQFEDLSVFERDQYRANLHFVLDDAEYEFVLLQSRMNEDEVSIVIKEQDFFSDSNKIEKEKVDTIQESLLFSMIVNLADDSCINPNTTEVRSDRQDFMDIKYSDWRLKISKMFKEEDRILFLRTSSPENVINTLESKTRFHIDLQMMNMQGQYSWSRLSFVRMKGFSRENPRFLYTVNDITEDMNQLLRQEGLTKAVEEQNAILQREDREKTRFFANMSHEFRAPINAIIGMNEVIRCNSKEETIREYAEDIKNASNILLHLVNDVLDFSKIQAGKMEIVPVEYETEELVQNVSNMVKLLAQNKNLVYEVRIDENVPKRLFGDEIRIAQILTNLLTNAVKYTTKGRITLSIQAVKDGQGMDAILYQVEDTGCGIRKEDMEKLFTAYGRLDLERNRRVEGTGLGIGIVTGLLEAMNSRLQVESEYEKGSRFWFVLTQNFVDVAPMEASVDRMPSKKKLDIGDKKILVVDDVPINLKVAKVLLQKYGVNPDLVDSGEKALEMMKKTDYDLVFLDHMMPGMNGVETLEQVRKMNDYYQTAPVIALTGNVSTTARDEYLCFGFTDYLEKPIMPEKIEELLRTYLQ